MKHPLLCGIVVALTATLAGCGQKSLPTKSTYPVQGKVTLNGEPVAFAIITFEPAEGKGFPATAYTDKDGAFSGARTFSNNEMDGMVPGEYNVKLEGYSPLNAAKFLGTKPEADEKATTIPTELTDTGKTVVVEAGDNSPVDIQLP
jgi:hypothetical protein